MFQLNRRNLRCHQSEINRMAHWTNELAEVSVQIRVRSTENRDADSDVPTKSPEMFPERCHTKIGPQ